MFISKTSVYNKAGLTFRVGDEVFLCSKQVPNTSGRRFLLYGIGYDSKNPRYSPVILMDRDGFEQDPKNLQVFRLVHLGKIAHFPGGKSASSTQQIVNAAFSLFETFLDKMQELCGGVCVVERFVLDGKDWLALKKQAPTYSYNTRPRKSQQGQDTHSSLLDNWVLGAQLALLPL